MNSWSQHNNENHDRFSLSRKSLNNLAIINIVKLSIFPSATSFCLGGNICETNEQNNMFNRLGIRLAKIKLHLLSKLIAKDERIFANYC